MGRITDERVISFYTYLPTAAMCLKAADVAAVVTIMWKHNILLNLPPMTFKVIGGFE